MQHVFMNTHMQTKGQIHKGQVKSAVFLHDVSGSVPESCMVTYKHRSECSMKGMVFKNTPLSSFTRSHVVPNLHDLLSSEEDKRKC